MDIVIGVIERGGRFLIQPRVGDPGLGPVWELPGGKCEPGETHARALVREVAEETGLDVSAGNLVVAFGHTYPDRRVVMYVYRCRPTGGEPPPPAAWVTVTEAADYPMPVGNRAILDALAWGGEVDSGWYEGVQVGRDN